MLLSYSSHIVLTPATYPSMHKTSRTPSPTSPLTYLAPSGRREVFVVEGVEFEVIEVEPKFGS